MRITDVVAWKSDNWTNQPNLCSTSPHYNFSPWGSLSSSYTIEAAATWRSVMAKSEELSGEQKMSPLRWCSITSVYTPLSTALFLLFKCLSISLTQHYFTVSCTKYRWGVIWAPSWDQPGATESVIALLFPASGAMHLRHSAVGRVCIYTHMCETTATHFRVSEVTVGVLELCPSLRI